MLNSCNVALWGIHVMLPDRVWLDGQAPASEKLFGPGLPSFYEERDGNAVF